MSLINRRQFTAGLLAGGAAMTALPRRASAAGSMVFLTDWKAQAEHGGFYAAKALDLYRKHGLDLDLRQGGPSQNTQQLMAAGAVDLALGSSNFFLLNMIQVGASVKAVAAFFQKDAAVLMVHPDSGINSVADMAGHPIYVSPGGVVSNYLFMKAKLGFTDEQLRPYNFNLAPFLADKTSIQQGLLSSEPFTAKKEGGVDTKVFLLADSGYSTYANLILASHKTLAERKDEVQAFVNASIEGWNEYLYGNPEAANALIKQDNPEMTDELLAYSRSKMLEYGIVDSGDSLQLGLGAMTDARWKDFYDVMVTAGVYPSSLDYKSAFVTDFVNKGFGLDQKAALTRK